MRPPLHVATAGSVTPGRAGVVAAALRWDGDPHSRVVVRRLRRGERTPPAYRAVLLALWEARRMGARAVVVGTDDADAAERLSGSGSPPPEATVAWLQIRALLHAFRSAEVRYLPPGRDPDAARAAAAVAHRGQPVYTDLPLWAAAAS